MRDLCAGGTTHERGIVGPGREGCVGGGGHGERGGRNACRCGYKAGRQSEGERAGGREGAGLPPGQG